MSGKVLRARFWPKMDMFGAIHPTLGTPCWVWRAATNKRGYGTFKWARIQPKGKTTLAHRLAWEFLLGPVPGGLFVLHRCDNPSCCNPAHLWLGTNADNMRDMKEKGRAVSPRSRWTHCIRGHELAGDNLVTKKSGYRGCRTCINARQRGQAMLKIGARILG